MVSNVVLGSALRNTLLSLNRTQDTVDIITERLASGKDVNSAVDDPASFFTARSLQNEASDNARLLDGIGQSIRVIQEGVTGLEAINQLINQAEAIVETSRDFLEAGDVDPAIFEKVIDTSPQPLSTQILNASPDAYFRLNETGGAIQDFGALGPVVATRLGGASPNAAPLYTNGSAPSVDFDGVSGRILVADAAHININATPARTVELVFNADTTAGRQVLYEEGAGINGLTIYIDNGSLYVSAEDDSGANRYVDININAPIVAGQTYHAAFVFNGASGPADGGGGANTFSGYLDGVNIGTAVLAGDNTFPSHSGNIGIGAAVDGVQFHDGESGAGFRFDGRISDVAIYNQALTEATLASHASAPEATTSLVYLNREYEAILEQIDLLVIDAQYRGINLLAGEGLTTFFNPGNTSALVTEGRDLSRDGLGLSIRSNFTDINTVDLILEQIREAREYAREYASTLTNNINIIKIRSDFTSQNVNTLLSGADDLVLSDANRDGADLLATQTRQNLGTTALSLAAQSQSSTLRLFS